MFKVLSQQVRVTLTKAFEKHLTIEELPQGSTYVQVLLQLSIMKWKLTKLPRKSSATQKSKLVS